LQTILDADIEVAAHIEALDKLREDAAAESPKPTTETSTPDLEAKIEPEEHSPIEALENGANVTIDIQVPGQLPDGSTAEPETLPTELPLEQFVAKIELEEPPKIRVSEDGTSKRQRRYQTRTVDFGLVDELNRRLGKRGECLVVEYERRRLIAAGRTDLAERVEHVSETQGDGAGYDVLSFSDIGEEMYIEVKATNLGKHSPFLISINELEFSSEHTRQFYLYRIFNLADSPRLFILKGSLNEHRLEPIQFRVSF
jgi:hypothetical protein